jgi:hypothetical protein
MGLAAVDSYLCFFGLPDQPCALLVRLSFPNSEIDGIGKEYISACVWNGTHSHTISSHLVLVRHR